MDMKSKAVVYRAGGSTVHDHGEHTTREVTRVGPTFQLKLLGHYRILALSCCRVGIASVGADQTIDHQLE